NGIFAGPKGQDRATGDMNDFWYARDLLPFVKNIKAAVLLAHGFNDYNVVPEHSVRIYDEMKARGLPVSIYLHQGGHGEPLVQPLPVWRRQRSGEGSAGMDRPGLCFTGAGSGRPGRPGRGDSN